MDSLKKLYEEVKFNPKNLTVDDIRNAEELEIVVGADTLYEMGWNMVEEYEDFKEDSTFPRSDLWKTFESWLDNTHVRLRVDNQHKLRTTYEFKWYDGHSWINALGGDHTGDDDKTIQDIYEIIQGNDWWELITYYPPE